MHIWLPQLYGTSLPGGGSGWDVLPEVSRGTEGEKLSTGKERREGRREGSREGLREGEKRVEQGVTKGGRAGGRKGGKDEREGEKEGGEVSREKEEEERVRGEASAGKEERREGGKVSRRKEEERREREGGETTKDNEGGGWVEGSRGREADIYSMLSDTGKSYGLADQRLTLSCLLCLSSTHLLEALLAGPLQPVLTTAILQVQVQAVWGAG